MLNQLHIAADDLTCTPKFIFFFPVNTAWYQFLPSYLFDSNIEIQAVIASAIMTHVNLYVYFYCFLFPTYLYGSNILGQSLDKAKEIMSSTWLTGLILSTVWTDTEH